MNERIRLLFGENDQIPDFTRDVAGFEVDLRTEKWRLNSATSGQTLIDWNRVKQCDGQSVLALRLHIVRLIETNGTAHVANAFRLLSSFLADLRDCRNTSFPSLPNILWYLERLRTKSLGYQFHYIKKWYASSADRLLDGFEDEIVFAIEDIEVGGNSKGFAVLSADPELGPLTEFEEMALRQALIRDDGPIEERAALWLAFAFGTNPANLALLREEDFVRNHFSRDTPSAYFLKMPRIKKHQPERTDFKIRSVDNPLADIIEELVVRNAGMAPHDSIRPLFRIKEPRQSLAAGPLRDYAHHPAASMITGLIATCVARLGVKSPRTGEPLKVTTRRLRYTFASKMVRMGVPPRELAELLDHTDTQNIQVYYKADSRFVERLDATIAQYLGPIIRAFMGEIINRVKGAKDLIPFRDLPELGQCGASFVCGLSAPRNCYSCGKFKAFSDGPHEAILIDLIGNRNELLEAGAERMAQQLDPTILAVGEVIARIRGKTK